MTSTFIKACRIFCHLKLVNRHRPSEFQYQELTENGNSKHCKMFFRQWDNIFGLASDKQENPDLEKYTSFSCYLENIKMKLRFSLNVTEVYQIASAFICTKQASEYQ